MPRKPEIIAKQGKKTIALSVHFWTNGITRTRKAVLRREAHAKGYVAAVANKDHGISPLRNEKFNSIDEIPMAIKKCLAKHGIILHLTKGDSRVLRSRQKTG